MPFTKSYQINRCYQIDYRAEFGRPDWDGTGPFPGPKDGPIDDRGIGLRDRSYRIASWGEVYTEIKEDGEIISSCMTDHNGPIKNVFEPCLLGKVSGDTVVSPEVI